MTELRILGVDRHGTPLIEHIAALEQLEILSLVEVKVDDDELKMLRGAKESADSLGKSTISQTVGVAGGVIPCDLFR